MTRTFCDVCGIEIPRAGNGVADRIRVRHGRLSVEVMVAVDDVWNGGHACRFCVREAIKQGDQIDGSGVRSEGVGSAVDSDRSAQGTTHSAPPPPSALIDGSPGGSDG